MRLTIFILVIPFLFCLASCTKAKEKPSSTTIKANTFVQFGAHRWVKESMDCQKEEKKCATVKLDYPEAIFGTDQVRQNINDQIKKYVSEELIKAVGSKPGNNGSIEEMAEFVLAEYNPGDQKTFEEVSIFGRLMFRNPNMIKIELSSYMKSVEGKVKSNRSLYTFDTSEGKILSQTILNNGAPKLANITMNQ